MPSSHSRSIAALKDILDNAEFAREVVKGLDYEGFASDRRSIYVVTRCLEIISEASRRLDDEIKSRNQHLPWREIADAGNIYRHVYDAVNPIRLWKTLTTSVPFLEEALRVELHRVSQSRTDETSAPDQPS